MNEGLRLIAERDDWICHLCDKPVQKNLPKNHPMRPTKDHVIPAKHQESIKLHGNLRLAHWRCNNERGSMSVEAYRKRIGLDAEE